MIAQRPGTSVVVSYARLRCHHLCGVLGRAGGLELSWTDGMRCENYGRGFDREPTLGDGPCTVVVGKLAPLMVLRDKQHGRERPEAVGVGFG
jgi:hypothetical protein